jgi:hypothetical protein
MNIYGASKKFGRFELHFEVLGAFALGFGFNAFHHVLALGVSLGPLVISLAYTQPQPVVEPPKCKLPE